MALATATEPIRRVSRWHPCTICGKTKWCGVTSNFVICMRAPSDRPTQNGGWLHPLGPERPADLPPPPPRSGEPAAPVEHRHRVYRELLGLLSLDERHRENLRRRGLEDDAALERLHYRSLPLKGRAQLVRALGERLGQPPEDDSDLKYLWLSSAGRRELRGRSPSPVSWRAQAAGRRVRAGSNVPYVVTGLHRPRADDVCE